MSLRPFSDPLVRAYLDALDFRAVYVTTSPAKNKTKIGSSRDPAVAFKALRKADKLADVIMLGWCPAGHADLLIQGAIVPPTASGEEAAQLVEQTAQDLGVKLLSELQLREAAKPVVEHVDAIFRRMLTGGELRDLNRRYRTERLARGADRKGYISYKRWIEKQKLEMVRATAQLGGPRMV